MVQADLLVDAVVGGGLADVIQNPRPIRDRLRLGPWLERIAQREHVAVGADAWIAEQIPGAADTVAALEDRIALAGAFLLQVVARADAGQPELPDQPAGEVIMTSEHVDVLIVMITSPAGWSGNSACRYCHQLVRSGGKM